jgi:hypothetical protein
LDLIEERRSARRDAKKDASLKSHYNSLNKILKAEIIKFNSKKWDDFLDLVGHKLASSKPLWKKINSIRQNTTTKNKIPAIKQNGITLTSDEDKAKAFADNLSNIFKGSSNNGFDAGFARKTELEVDEYLKDQTETIGEEITSEEVCHEIKT